MAEESKFSLVKPTVDTPFHIDFDWWKQHDSDWRVFLVGLMCEPHQKVFYDLDENIIIDFIDPRTAEVKAVDGLVHTLLTHCAQQPDFISTSGSLVATVFRIFLSNNNTPLTSNELANMIKRPASIILVTLSSPTVYKGIRPIYRK